MTDVSTAKERLREAQAKVRRIPWSQAIQRDLDALDEAVSEVLAEGAPTRGSEVMAFLDAEISQHRDAMEKIGVSRTGQIRNTQAVGALATLAVLKQRAREWAALPAQAPTRELDRLADKWREASNRRAPYSGVERRAEISAGTVYFRCAAELTRALAALPAAPPHDTEGK
jgi:hypothetical protein